MIQSLVTVSVLLAICGIIATDGADLNLFTGYEPMYQLPGAVTTPRPYILINKEPEEAVTNLYRPGTRQGWSENMNTRAKTNDVKKATHSWYPIPEEWNRQCFYYY